MICCEKLDGSDKKTERKFAKNNRRERSPKNLRQNIRMGKEIQTADLI